MDKPLLKEGVAPGDQPLGLISKNGVHQQFLEILTADTLDVDRALALISRMPTPPRWGTGTVAGELAERFPASRTLGDHTRNASRQERRYFPNESDVGFSRAGFRFLMLAHDLGKAAARRAEGGTGNQSAYTEELLDFWFKNDLLPMDAQGFERLKTVLRSDPLGPYLRLDSKQVPLEPTVDILEQGARQSGMSLPAYFKTVARYYQSDAASYTSEVNYKPQFDKVFAFATKGPKKLQFNEAEGRIVFSPDVEARWVALQEAVEARARAAAEGPTAGAAAEQTAAARELPEGFPQSLSELSIIKGLPRDELLLEDAQGRRWVSSPASGEAGHARESVLADKLYRVFGYGVPSAIYDSSGGERRLFPSLPGALAVSKAASRDPRVDAETGKAFAVHALLAHTDVAEGRANSVRMVLGDGAPRVNVVETSGALRREYSGEAKEFGPALNELWAMRQSGPFSRLSWSDVVRQMEGVLAKRSEVLAAASEEPAVQSMLRRRLDNLQYLVDATAALRAEGLSTAQVDAGLGRAMAYFRETNSRPKISTLVKQLKPEPPPAPEPKLPAPAQEQGGNGKARTDAAPAAAKPGSASASSTSSTQTADASARSAAPPPAAPLKRTAGSAVAIAAADAPALRGAAFEPGVTYELGKFRFRVLEEVESDPQARRFRVEHNLPGLEDRQLMTLLKPSEKVDFAARTDRAERRSGILSQVAPDVFPETTAGAPGVFFQKVPEGVSIEQLPEPLQETAMDNFLGAVEIIKGLPDFKDGARLGINDQLSNVRFNPETGRLSGYTGGVLEA